MLKFCIVEYSGVMDVYGSDAYTFTDSRFANQWNKNVNKFKFFFAE